MNLEQEKKNDSKRFSCLFLVTNSRFFFPSLNRSHQFNSRIVSTQFASQMTWNDPENNLRVAKLHFKMKCSLAVIEVVLA